MAEQPNGRVTDEERLVPLLAQEDGLVVDVTGPVEAADVPEAGAFAWHLREGGDVPRLAFAPAENPEEGAPLQTRAVTRTDDGLSIEVPDPLLGDALGLDTARYADDNPLLFEADEIADGVVIGSDSGSGNEPGTGPGSGSGGTATFAIELVPRLFADGTPYRSESTFRSHVESDPVAEAVLDNEPGGTGTPQFRAICAPVAAPIVDAVLGSVDAPPAAVVDVLETMERRDLVTEADDDSRSDPLVVEDRVIVALDEDTWLEKVGMAVEADDAAVDAAREIHARQAADLLRRSRADRSRFDGRAAVVLESGRRFESDAAPE